MTIGPYLFRFQDEVKRFLGLPYFLATSTGTSALHIAIKVLGLGKQDELIISPLVHIGVANTIYNEGISLVLADVERDSLNLNPESVKKLIVEFYENRSGELINRATGKVLKGIVLYNIYGTPVKMDSFLKIKDEFNLILLEVCWESFGNKYFLDGDYKVCGSAGDVAVFSFTRYGPVNVGEGGGVVFRNVSDYEKGEKIRYHGVDAEYVEYQAIFGGFNYNLDEMSCAIGLGQMMRISEILNKRERAFYKYEKLLSETPDVKIVSQCVKKIIVPYALTILIPENVDRKRIVEYMHSSGVPTKVFYPPLHKLGFYNGAFSKENLSMLNVTEKVAPRILSLPFYGDIDDKDVEYVVEKLREALKDSG